jgi:hypothetical protein
MTTAVRIVFLSFLLLTSIGTAAAACLHNGRSYPEGTTVGDRVCINGNWVRR